MNDRKDDDELPPDSEEQPASLWVNALGVVSLMFFAAIIMYIPWGYYYKHTLLWDDDQGVSVFLGILSVLNAFSLLVRVRLVEETNTPWSKVEDQNVSMAISSLANILFWAGLALYLVAHDLNVNKTMSIAVAAVGSMGHAVLQFARWRATKLPSAGFLTAMYSAIFIGLVIFVIVGLSGGNIG